MCNIVAFCSKNTAGICLKCTDSCPHMCASETQSDTLFIESCYCPKSHICECVLCNGVIMTAQTDALLVR